MVHKVVDVLDPTRITGKWHEVARFCNPFEPASPANVDIKFDKQAKVLKVQKLYRDAKGHIMKNVNGTLRLSCNPNAKGGDLVYTSSKGNKYPYLVHDLDYKGHLIVCSGPFLWVYSRKNFLTQDEAEKVLKVVCAGGHDANKLLSWPSVVVRRKTRATKTPQYVSRCATPTGPCSRTPSPRSPRGSRKSVVVEPVLSRLSPPRPGTVLYPT